MRFTTLMAQSTEWFDFFLYTTAAAIVFPTVFFSAAFSPLAATLSSFATVSVGFVVRPIGGALFGHFGDSRGRKPALVVALLLMAASTLLIAVLPGFATLGLAAPVLLTLLRVLQGLALGGQWGGAVLVATEYAPPGKRGAYSAWAQVGLPIGLALSSGAFLVVVGLFDPTAFLVWGWRIPFVIGGLLVLAALAMQLRLQETPAFRNLAAQATTVPRSPVIEVVRRYPGRILVTVGVFLVVGGSFYVITTGTLAYATGTLGIGRQTMLLAIIAGAALMAVVIFPAASASDRYGRRRVFAVGVLVSLASLVPFAALVGTGDPLLAGIGVAMAMGLGGIMYGPTAVMFSESFPVRLRYSGASLGYQVSNVVGGGIAPLIMTSLLAATGSLLSVVLYVAVMGVITLISLRLLGAPDAEPDPGGTLAAAT
ncbi:MFS transporter [Pseudonocardia xishanensis]|uniref:MFS transporter n=2 Tax=Pseudonocardia xishanensis TaxID=630995 RepID=A0ABP8RRX6_9PSEU